MKSWGQGFWKHDKHNFENWKCDIVCLQFQKIYLMQPNNRELRLCKLGHALWYQVSPKQDSSENQNNYRLK